ncbi:MAG: DUF4209 domain-containing protein [Crocinitomicaceae bacterium]|nr:DUF4209 domain-containing protein [Crocinitomicaceae bacterium]
MKDLNTIQDFYDQVEQHDRSWVFDSNSSSALSKLIELKIDPENSKKLVWEKAVFNYSIKKGVLVPKYGATGPNGEVMSYPNMVLFEDRGFEYLEERSEEVKNQWLIAKYNHLLWLSPKKNLNFATKAINSYFDIFTLIKDDEKVQPFDKVEIVKNLIVLCFQSNQKVSESKALLKSILFENGYWIHDWKVTFLRFMLEQSKFKKADFEGSIDLISSINEVCDQNGDYSTIHDNLEVAIRLAEKYKWLTKNLFVEMGMVCEKISENKSDDTSKMIALMYLSEALHYYEKAKLKNSSERVSVQITELKKDHELAKISIPFEGDGMNILVGFYKETAFSWLDHAPNDIYSALTQHNTILFPDLDKMNESEKNKEFRLYNLFNTIKFDINSNITKKTKDFEENKRNELINSYELKMKFSVNLFLLPLFDEGIRRGQLNYENLRQYLINHSWIGQHQFNNRSGDRIAFSWLEVIAPALQEFFIQFELMQTIGKSNFSLVVDSLTLKFEGIFRNFAQKLGVQTLTTYKNSEPGAVREMYIEDLLKNEKVQEYFDENDRTFFNYLFLNGGLNLRNNVAHCFMRPTDYNITTVMLLLLAILRLSKYKIQDKVTVN